MTKLADCGGRHAAHRYAQNALSDVFRFSLAKTYGERRGSAGRHTLSLFLAFLG